MIEINKSNVQFLACGSPVEQNMNAAADDRQTWRNQELQNIVINGQDTVLILFYIKGYFASKLDLELFFINPFTK